MSTNGEKSFGPATHRIILLSERARVEDTREITKGSTFLYGKEHKLQNVLLEAFAEMAFVVRKYTESHADLLANGTPELATYIEDLNNINPPPSTNFIVELHALDLSTHFKCFLILAKAVLDKVVPFFSYQFYDNLEMFSDKGDRLITRIKSNKHVQKKTEFISLIERVKREWLDTLVDLRDEYAHYSNLKEYTNFLVCGESIGERKFTGIQDFHRPSILFAGNRTDALDYMLSIKAELIRFLHDFLQLCEFTPDRRPKFYLSCEECHFVFARRAKHDKGKGKGKVTLMTPNIMIQVRDLERNYGVIICHKCGGETDADLEFWKKEGLTLQ